MKTVQHRFVESVPEQLEEGIVYVSLTYCTAIHLCVCGCGNEVVTPLSPADWQMTFDGETISLSPSIGNWSFPCQSHYWISSNQIRHARRWTKSEIESGKRKDKWERFKYFKKKRE